MISVWIEPFERGNIRERITTECPYCGDPLVFFMNTPIRCSACRRVLPDIKGIINNTSERLRYHRDTG
jgi:hypothetical protein